MFTIANRPDSDLDYPINFQVATSTAVTVGPIADWHLSKMANKAIYGQNT